MISYSQIIDISRPVDEGMVLYPGDEGVGFEKKKDGEWHYAVLHFTTHTGTHVDSPTHVRDEGRTVDRIKLGKLVGPCRVLDMTHVDDEIDVMDLEVLDIKKGERLLFKTKNSSRGYKEFYPDYVHLNDDGARYLAQKEVALIGADYLSIEKYHKDAVSTHRILLDAEIALVESLNLSKVEVGNYGLVVLPLRLVGLDGAPARAILLKD
ncbi:MAG: cyclase [Candidatus Vogelbacteria bacterium CG10_big_fil_rev_8_21_14_0_10_45_14]|uniref:Kynurenine formamidase n=1 Tax=Candidatus Vogelbacteria bacterium CG10_big_fil_rev_8_21_14_0_10_45_14 TaxID=1975042 RepID=A0A2H0RKS6_9BACT|nr:MAG: cyclase [Candidatus Vogelbacteria bacterium CG10_big_fil_rev_8_21_14_0_10_45_14]